jgi:hypothetical protein
MLLDQQREDRFVFDEERVHRRPHRGRERDVSQPPRPGHPAAIR